MLVGGVGGKCGFDENVLCIDNFGAKFDSKR